MKLKLTKRMLFPILMTSRRTLSTRADGISQPAQWCPWNHKTEICPWLAAVRGQILCLKTEMISVSVSSPFGVCCCWAVLMRI